MAGKPRCVKLHIHTSLRVSYSTIHCINVSVKSKFQHPPPGIPRAFDVFSYPGGREFDEVSLPCSRGVVVGNLGWGI